MATYNAALSVVAATAAPLYQLSQQCVYYVVGCCVVDYYNRHHY
jgi:hypothetical protein